MHLPDLLIKGSLSGEKGVATGGANNSRWKLASHFLLCPTEKQRTETLFHSAPLLQFKGACMWLRLRPSPSAQLGRNPRLAPALPESGAQWVHVASPGYSSIARQWELRIQKGWGLVRLGQRSIYKNHPQRRTQPPTRRLKSFQPLRKP